jgi:hypothetical protein
MAQYVFSEANVLAGPFERAEDAMLEEVRLSREDAAEKLGIYMPDIPEKFIRYSLENNQAVPYGHRFPVRKGRRVSDSPAAPNRYFVLREG